MDQKNRYFTFSKIFEARFRHLVGCFAMDLTATETSVFTGLSVRTVNAIFLRIRLLSLLKTNGKSPHGERPVSRIANGDSCHGEHLFLRGRSPVRESQSGFYSPAPKESSLETFPDSDIEV
jgi:hypothetical protein